MNVIINLQIINPTMYMLIIIITIFCILIKPSTSSLSPPIYPHTTIEEYLKELQIPLENHWNIMKILSYSKEMIENWGGKLHLIYLPSYFAYASKNENRYYSYVLETAKNYRKNYDIPMQ